MNASTPPDAATDFELRRKAGYSVTLVVCVAMLVVAFVAAPHSCEWGLDTYAIAGVVGLAVLLTMPFALRIGGNSLLVRAGWAAVFAAAGACVWFAGLFAASFRIMCRLF